jgi:hypothetical protein
VGTDVRRAAALGVVLLVVALGACSRSEERPSGVTERFLQAVSDTGRERVREDALERAGDDGDADLVDALLPVTSEPHDDDESLFADLEVGRAVERDDTARVPFRLTMTDDDSEVFATAVLTRDGDSWRVTGVDAPAAGELVPSEGGDRAASATGRHWLAAVAAGVLLAVVSGLVIELQPLPSPTGRAALTAD